MKTILNKEVRMSIVIMVLLALMAVTAGTLFVLKTSYQYTITLPTRSLAQTFQYGSWPALENADFYNQVFQTMIDQKATFISANLSTMQLSYYENGVLAQQFTILAKGKPGSWWETPAGLYKVEFKTAKDFSSFAHVYSPWALDFQGNFFIHGWPYYPDGTPVASTYSGGCIRLSTPDAKTLYDLVAVGTPVLVSSANFTQDGFRETTQAPPIEATSYLAADLKSNFVLAAKNPDQQVPIASITKLMTALVAVEYINIEKTVTITPDMVVKTSIPRLKAGQSYSIYDLLGPLLKESSNEAATAIADSMGQKYFVSLMNKTAQSIGMKDTHFVDPSGSSWDDVSTAHDLFLLAQYLEDNRSFILKMTTNNTGPSPYGPSSFTGLQNFNVFADNPNFIGGKVGINGGAGDTILSVFRGSFTGSTSTPQVSTSTPDTASAAITVTRPYMFVILGSSNYTADAQNFLSWIQTTYH